MVYKRLMAVGGVIKCVIPVRKLRLNRRYLSLSLEKSPHGGSIKTGSGYVLHKGNRITSKVGLVMILFTKCNIFMGGGPP